MGIFLSETFLSQENSFLGLHWPAASTARSSLPSRSGSGKVTWFSVQRRRHWNKSNKMINEVNCRALLCRISIQGIRKRLVFWKFSSFGKKNWVWPDLDSNPSNKSFKKTSFVGNERLIFLLNSKPWNLSVQSNHVYLETQPSLSLQNPSQSKRQISKRFFLDLGRVERKHFGRWIDK